MLAKKRREKKYEAAIPMINVVFLLLIYFMVVGQLKEHEEFIVSPPESSYESNFADNDQVDLLVNSDGQLVLKGELIGLDDLLIVLENFMNQTDELIIKADKLLPMVELMAIINELKQSNYENIKLLMI